jgi:hypothetical protein
VSRDDGFDVADVATGLYDDPKVKALWRAIGDQGRVSHALALHMVTLLASWRQGNRVTVQEAVPVWLEPDAELIAALQAVRLLDKTGRLPVRSWKGWYHPAAERRDVLRERWRRANVKRAARIPRGYSAGTATPGPSGPDRPSGPLGPSSPRAAARGETVQGTRNGRGGPQSLSELLPDAFAASRGGKP